jgi:crotonobetainyl-CoA:carnitine CoA-transferase CaiB-like acyl-CoA transferase
LDPGSLDNPSKPIHLPRPLEGTTVLDMTVALAGPFATLLLGGLGARVIKIENPAGGDTSRSNAPYLGRNGPTLTRENEDDISISALNRLRNKLGITLNLKSPEARAVFADLVKSADVVVENFSRGTLERLGVGYASAREINPRIIYCSITGFGSAGDTGSGKAMDAIIQALSGVMLTSGEPDDPPVRVGVPFADLCAPLFGVIGVLAALHQARSTGTGQQVDISMLGVLTMMVACESYDILKRCGVPLRTGQTVPRLAPFGIYPTRDGFIAVCAPTDLFARSLFDAMGRPELGTSDRFATRDLRVTNSDELNMLVENFTRSMTTAETIAKLDAAGVPSAEVRHPDAAMRDPRVVARRETVPLAHPKYGDVGDVYGMGMPIHFSSATAEFDRPAPALGEHNEAVYGDMLGYSAEKIAVLRSRKVI